MKLYERVLSMLLIAAMLLSTVPGGAFATDCHPEHTGDCGYNTEMESGCTHSCSECAVEPTEEPAEEPTEEPAEDPTEEPSEETEEESTEEPTRETIDEAVEDLRALLEELPSVEELKEMSLEEQNTWYLRTQEAYGAWQELTDDQKLKIPEAEGVFGELFTYFNSLTAPAEVVTGTCGASLSWSLNRSTGKLTISGTGSMDSFLTENPPWHAYRSEITSVSIGSGVTSVGGGAFKGYSALTSVILPGTLTSIGQSAFYGTSLTAVQLPEGMKSLGSYVFLGCTNLTQVNLPGSLTTIDAAAFEGCTALKSVTVGEGITTLSNSTFAECTALTQVSLPSTLTTLEEWTFYGCTSLTTIDLPEGLTTLDYYVFEDCTGLTSIDLPDSLTAIGRNVFSGCTGLTSFTFPAGITSLGEELFLNCTSLTELIFLGSSPEASFSNCLTTLTANGYYPAGDATWEDGFFKLICGGNITWMTQGSEPEISGQCGNSLNWTIENGVLTISGTGAMYNYQWDAPWTDYAGSITKVIIRDGATTIGDTAFRDMYNLTSLSVADSVKQIGDYAFRDCMRLSSLTLPTKLESIGASAFTGCDAINGLTIPEGVTTIGDSAFNSCEKLTAITLPESLTDIGEYAFLLCPLKEITIPSGVTALKKGVFQQCTALKTVTLPDAVTSVGQAAFNGCTALESITLPASVTELGGSAFSGCKSLAGLTLPENLTAIGDYAFSGCTGLKELTIPASVSTLGDFAFSGSGLVEVTFSGSAPSFGLINNTGTSQLFEDVTATVYYPAGDTSWDSVKNKNYGGYLTWAATCSGHIEETAGEKTPTCTETGYSGDTVCTLCGEILKEGEELPAYGHTYNDASKCVLCGAKGGTCGEKLKWYIDEETNTLYITGTGAMTDYSASASTPIRAPWYRYSNLVEHVVIGEGVTSIGRAAFNDCSDMQDVVLPSGVTSVGMEAFMDCSSLESAVLPDTVTTIGSQAFHSCSALEGVTIPAEVTSIPSYTFTSCNALKDVYYGSNEKAWDAMQIGSANDPLLSATIHYTNLCVQGHNYQGVVTAPSCTTGGFTTYTCSRCDDSYTADETAALAHSFASNTHICSGCGLIGGECGSDACWTLVDGTLTVTGTGYMDSYSTSNPAPWMLYKDQITSVIIESGILNISSNGFRDCTNLSSVSIADTASVIEMASFLNCSSLTAIDIPGSVVAIESRAFENCTALSQISLTEGLERIYSAFKGCTSLTSAAIPEGVTTIGAEAFRGCTALTSVSLPSTLTSTGNYVFYNCSSLISISIPESLTRIETYMFYGCTSLTSVTIPETITCIDNNAFTGCKSLKAITIPQSVTKIGGSAFSQSGLTSVVIPGGVTSMGSAAFQNCSALASVTIENGVSNIEDWAFRDCVALTEITLPASISKTGYQVFFGCSSLSTIRFLGDAPLFGEGTFAEVTADAFYPGQNSTWTEDKLLDYDGTITWRAYCTGSHSMGQWETTVEPTCTQAGERTRTCEYGCGETETETVPATGHSFADGVCTGCGLTDGTLGEDITWGITDGVLTVTGTGDVSPSEPAPWAEYADSIHTLVVEEGVTGIGVNAFRDLTSLKKVTLPDGLEALSGGAFSGCSALESVIIPATVTSIGYQAFDGCTALKEVTFLGDAPAIDSTAFTGVTANANRPLDNETWTEDKLQNYGGTLTWNRPESGNRVTVDPEEAGSTFYVDGQPVPVVRDGDSAYILLPEGASSMLVTYTWHIGDAADVHTQYPTGMKVYRVVEGENGMTAQHIPELDDLLQYSGSSIRITGNKGIRMITSLTKGNKSALTGGGLVGYTLEEYGTALCWASDLAPGVDLVLGQSYTRSNYAYKKGVADPIFASPGNLIQYTNVLVGFTDDQCIPDIAMRPYIILTDTEGNQVTLYGGTVYRSIGYIAYQNRTVFSPGTDSYDYVWSIIHHVYGDKYDADYQG